MARQVTIFMELGWGGPGRGLTTSLHLKCHISCPTWPDILWIFGPFSKKLSINGQDILRKNSSDFVNLNGM